LRDPDNAILIPLGQRNLSRSGHPRALKILGFSLCLRSYRWHEICGKLCDMGNKDAHRREVKKPKKQKPKPQPFTQTFTQTPARIPKEPPKS